MRVQFGGKIFRLFGFFEHGTRLILTHGFAKKAQKTSAQDITNATQHEYLSRRRQA